MKPPYGPKPEAHSRDNAPEELSAGYLHHWPFRRRQPPLLTKTVIRQAQCAFRASSGVNGRLTWSLFKAREKPIMFCSHMAPNQTGNNSLDLTWL